MAVGYGITEVGGVASDTRVLPGVELRLAEEEVDEATGDRVGRLWVKHATTMSSGYVDAPEAACRFDEHGYFDTGDIVRVSADGKRVHVLGRADTSAVKRANGTWWSANELEAALVPEHAAQACAFLIHERVCVIAHRPSDQLVRHHWPRWHVDCFIVADQPLALTATLKVHRASVLAAYSAALEVATKEHARPRNEQPDTVLASGARALALARELMGHECDPLKSLVDNGASSVVVAKFVARMAQTAGDWRRAIHAPLVQVDALCGASFVDQMSRDVAELAHFGAPSGPAMVGPGGAVLVTGARGFCGATVVAALATHAPTRRIVCLLRPGEALPASVNAAVVHGHLDQARFGLSCVDYDALAASVQWVLHFAARVDFTDTYAVARGPNVLGTHAVAAFCAAHGARLVHMSSASAVETRDRDDGYANSKWVAERIARAARSLVWRLPLVLFDTATGVGNPRDWLCKMLASARKLRAFPSLQTSLVVVTATQLALDVVALLDGGTEEPPSYYHLSLDTLVAQLMACTPGSRLVSHLEFVTLVRSDSSLACFSVLAMLPRPNAQPPLPPLLPVLHLSAEEVARFGCFLDTL